MNVAAELNTFLKHHQQHGHMIPTVGEPAGCCLRMRTAIASSWISGRPIMWGAAAPGRDHLRRAVYARRSSAGRWRTRSRARRA